MRARKVMAAATLGGALLVGGCGVPPELRPQPGDTVPSPSGQPPESHLPPGFTFRPSTPPSAAPFSETQAVDCAGKPTADQIIALVRRSSSNLPSGSQVKATKGPLCSGSWQYTIVQAPDLDPLQVVSKGPADSLTLVTAGTDICTIEVRNYAPAGLRLAARC